MNTKKPSGLRMPLEHHLGARAQRASSRMGRHNNCANRCYYACFQAAIAALIGAGVRPRSRDGRWGHGFADIGELVNRRKLYTSELRDALARTYAVRRAADYQPGPISETQAARALRRARALVTAVLEQGGQST